MAGGSHADHALFADLLRLSAHGLPVYAKPSAAPADHGARCTSRASLAGAGPETDCAPTAPSPCRPADVLAALRGLSLKLQSECASVVVEALNGLLIASNRVDPNSLLCVGMPGV